jgi:hypothetical protein
VQQVTDSVTSRSLLGIAELFGCAVSPGGGNESPQFCGVHLRQVDPHADKCRTPVGRLDSW